MALGGITPILKLARETETQTPKPPRKFYAKALSIFGGYHRFVSQFLPQLCHKTANRMISYLQNLI
jgi:hypothetical protein